MKIALMGPLDHFGGGPRVILELYKVLSKEHTVDIITDFYRADRTYSGFNDLPVQILEYCCRNIPFIRRFTVLKGWLDLDLSGYDLAIGTHAYSHMCALRNSNVIIHIISVRTIFQSPVWSGRKGILKYVEYLLNAPGRYYERKAVRSNRCVITLSEYCREKIRKLYGIHAEVVPLGVSVKEFIQKPAEDYCLYIGRLSPEKQIDRIIKAWSHVTKGLKLYIVGSGKADYTRYLTTLIDNRQDIRIMGPFEKDKLQELYAKCLCVIYVTTNEDFGMVAVESMAAGKPIIVSNEGGLIEIVRDNQDGFIIEPIPERIAEKVNMLNSDRKYAEELGTRGMERAKEFDWSIICSRLLAIGKEKLNIRL